MSMHRYFFATWFTAAIVGLNCYAQPEASAPDTAAVSQLEIKVSAGDPTKPIQGATVLVVSKERGQTFEREKTTNADGTVTVQKVPKGKVLIQVTAEGWKTTGAESQISDDKSKVDLTLHKEGDAK